MQKFRVKIIYNDTVKWTYSRRQLLCRICSIPFSVCNWLLFGRSVYSCFARIHNHLALFTLYPLVTVAFKVCICILIFFFQKNINKNGIWTDIVADFVYHLGCKLLYKMRLHGSFGTAISRQTKSQWYNHYLWYVEFIEAHNQSQKLFLPLFSCILFSWISIHWFVFFFSHS